jgi:hypothetical protein
MEVVKLAPPRWVKAQAEEVKPRPGLCRTSLKNVKDDALNVQASVLTIGAGAVGP